MTTFDFVTQKDLRASLEADYKELTACMEAKSWKAVHVLSGSIIEALLVDYLIASDYQKRSSEDPLSMMLADLIITCKKEKVISQKTADLCNVVKHYRNLIHPGRVIRLKEKVDEPTARISLSLVEIIVNEVSKARSESLGYTAEQIVSKIERDLSAVPILKHILKSTSHHELERLLLEVIPNKFISESFSQLDGGFDPTSKFCHALQSCFRQAKALASNEVKQAIAQKYVAILKEKDNHTVIAYGAGFFTCHDLSYLTEDDAVIVKEHLFSRLKEEANPILIEMLHGIGSSLKATEARAFALPLVKAIFLAPSSDIKKASRERFVAECSNVDTKVRNKLNDYLDEVIKFYEKNGLTDSLNLASKLKASIQVVDYIPF